MSNTNSGTETYAEKVDRIAAELLDVLRDVLGPERRLSGPRPDYARYGRHSVTVRDGEDGRVEVTAYLTTSGEVREYAARLTYGDSEPQPWPAVGPVRVDCSEEPEERPTLTYVLPLVVRLEEGERRMLDAQVALGVTGHPVERCGSSLVLREPRPWGAYVVATVELDPDSGALRVRGRDAALVQEVLSQAGVF